MNSTAKIQLSATWQERDDEQPPREVSAAVQTVALDPGASALKESLQHTFGDTRYRSVSYTATAVSRYRHFFNDAEVPEAFLLQGLLTSPVDILSSARPAPPVIVSTRPAYRWEEQQDHDAGSATIRRTRRASYLRVELARPWYETGDGELAAIVTSTDGKPPADASAFLTQVGGDPIWNSTPPPRWPTPATCTETAGPGGSVLLPELRQAVNIAVYQPWFGGQSWFVDVAMPSVAEASYCPLVQLAVCRYQPNSLFSEEPGAEIDLRLSSAVKAEFAPLFPERRLTVTRTESELRVLLEGLGPTGPHTNEVDAVLEHVALPAGVPASAVEFTALTLDPSGPVAWTAVAEQIQSGGALGTPIRLTMPADPGSYRVRVREVERVGKADDAAGSQLGTAGELSERVVFADVVAVPET